MKKTLFTICSIAIVCCTIIMSCTKNDDQTIKHVGYANQSGYGTGNNPNPNGLPYITPTVTPTNTITPRDTAGSISINGGSNFSLHDNGNNSFGFYSISGKPSSGVNPSVSINFSTVAAPVSNSYSIVASPSVGQCSFSFTDAGGNICAANAGTVSISVGSPNSICSFSGVICTGSTTTYTLSGTLHY